MRHDREPETQPADLRRELRFPARIDRIRTSTSASRSVGNDDLDCTADQLRLSTVAPFSNFTALPSRLSTIC
jgi:hypothetical protein